MIKIRAFKIGLCITAIVAFTNVDAQQVSGNILRATNLQSITIKGELATRTEKNFDRIEDLYNPDYFFKSKNALTWPGDAEGRAILALVLEARAIKRTPKYLDQIIAEIPQHLNKQGYFGPVYEQALNEQQLSGNGWVLRGLCAYYEWKHDPKVLAMIKDIVNNLFLKGQGKYKSYPIDPAKRKKDVGQVIGDIVKTDGQWILSSDIGCVFIGMEGLINAYKIVPSPQIKEVIDEMLSRFLETDLIGIKAQAHASLTACRGLIRYSELTGDKRYINEAAKRWDMYRSYGMTENFENYNWFDRFDTWSEPCAVVDSYMLAVQLWEHTHEARYLNDAELIYYNGICHAQRYNGGFGCDNTPGEGKHTNSLEVRTDEAYWCCTMRGAEGLVSSVMYSYFVEGNTVYVPFYHESDVTLQVGKSKNPLKLAQHTDYPFEGKIEFDVVAANGTLITLKLRVPVRASNYHLTCNGQPVAFNIEGGFATFKRAFNKGDQLKWTFDEQSVIVAERVNKINTRTNQLKVFFGPLMLGSEKSDSLKLTGSDKIFNKGKGTFGISGKDIELTPVYHLMDAKVWKEKAYRKQILF